MNYAYANYNDNVRPSQYLNYFANTHDIYSVRSLLESNYCTKYTILPELS